MSNFVLKEEVFKVDSSDLFKKFGLNPPEPFSTELSIHVGESHNEIRLIIKHHLNKLGFNNVWSDPRKVDS